MCQFKKEKYLLTRAKKHKNKKMPPRAQNRAPQRQGLQYEPEGGKPNLAHILAVKVQNQDFW